MGAEVEERYVSLCLRYFDKNFRCLLLSLAVYCLYLSTVAFYTNLNISYVFVSTAKKSSPVATTSTLNVTRPDVTPESSSALPSITPSPAEDPYAVWLAEQKKREKEWSKNRATKKAKIMVENESVLKSSESISCQNDQQLEAKTDKCTLVKSDLQELQHSNADAVKTTQESREILQG